MTRDEVEATLTQARQFGGFGLDPYFESLLSHDAEQRQAIDRLRKELELLKADDAERCTLIRDMEEEERRKDTVIEEQARCIQELEEWRKIVIGTGTDQEAVVRMAATEYTKSAVQCWKQKCEQQAQEIARLENGLGCSRSHLHEDMNQICELRTEVARLNNELSQRTNLEGSAPCWNSAHMKQIATLREALKTWQSLFRQAVNVAGSLTNYVEDRPELHHGERRLKLLEQQAQQAIKEVL